MYVNEPFAVSVALVFALVGFRFRLVQSLAHPPQAKGKPDESPERPLKLLDPVRCWNLREHVRKGLGADDARHNRGQARKGVVDGGVHGLRLRLRLRKIRHDERAVNGLNRAALRGELVGDAANVNAAEA